VRGGGGRVQNPARMEEKKHKVPYPTAGDKKCDSVESKQRKKVGRESSGLRGKGVGDPVEHLPPERLGSVASTSKGGN